MGKLRRRIHVVLVNSPEGERVETLTSHQFKELPRSVEREINLNGPLEDDALVKQIYAEFGLQCTTIQAKPYIVTKGKKPRPIQDIFIKLGKSKLFLVGEGLVSAESGGSFNNEEDADSSTINTEKRPITVHDGDLDEPSFCLNTTVGNINSYISERYTDETSELLSRMSDVLTYCYVEYGRLESREQHMYVDIVEGLQTIFKNCDGQPINDGTFVEKMKIYSGLLHYVKDLIHLKPDFDEATDVHMEMDTYATSHDPTVPLPVPVSMDDFQDLIKLDNGNVKEDVNNRGDPPYRDNGAAAPVVVATHQCPPTTCTIGTLDRDDMEILGLSTTNQSQDALRQDENRLYTLSPNDNPLTIFDDGDFRLSEYRDGFDPHSCDGMDMEV